MSSKDAFTLHKSKRDRLNRTARALVQAASVFGNVDYAAQWLNERNQALGGAIPRELLAAIEGEKLVRTELAAIEHGLPA